MALPNRRELNFLGLLLCAGLLGYALYAEHVLMLIPCPLCILQRIAVILHGLVFLIAALHNPPGKGRYAYVVLLALSGLFGAGVAGWHIWKQQQPPDPFASCAAGLDYLLETLPFRRVVELVFTGPGDCAVVDWQLLGLSMPAWVLIAIAGLMAGGIWNNLRPQARRPPNRPAPRPVITPP
jgi:disulfide bond formation protein DsbB